MGIGGETEGRPKSPAAVGVPYTPSPAQPVTEWSEAIYYELKDWPLARTGSWARWDPNYLVLTIDSYDGVPVEPVVIDTYEGELTITFGYWEAHLPSDGIYDETDSQRAVEAAKVLASDWLTGRIATAIFFDADDQWCGSKVLENPDDTSLLADTAWIEDFGPVRVELRKSRSTDWQHFRVANGKLSVSS